MTTPKETIWTKQQLQFLSRTQPIELFQHAQTKTLKDYVFKMR